MNSAAEHSSRESQSIPVSGTPVKRRWHAPEIEEVDFAETKNLLNAGSDGVLFS